MLLHVEGVAANRNLRHRVLWRRFCRLETTAFATCHLSWFSHAPLVSISHFKTDRYVEFLRHSYCWVLVYLFHQQQAKCVMTNKWMMG